MTSLSLKNHPTTAPHKATESQNRSLWKRFLAGTLCLCFAGAIPANDREVGKPLDRLKQRSARQRWREMRGDFSAQPGAAPQSSPTELHQPEIAPFSTRMRNRARPLPAILPSVVQEPTTPESAITVPVPAPVNLEPEVNRQASSHPSAKPPVDANEPFQHPGSFSEESLETRVSTPRKRDEIPLPHWPFQDDLDLVGQGPFDESSDVTDASRSAFSSVPSATVSKADAEPIPAPKPTRLYFSAQVAQAPAPEASPPVITADTTPPAPPAEQVPAPQAAADNPSVAGTLTPESDPLYRLKSIHDIQPFHDYMPNGGDPNDVLCPRPANADSSKTYKQCPVESAPIEQGSLERNNSVIPVYWMASNVYHNPLYFEDSSLERNGHSFSDAVQPFVSVGKFGAQFIALPYSIALDPVWKRETPLGHYRPGECAPKRHLAVPINGAAAATAAAAYTGIIFLTP